MYAKAGQAGILIAHFVASGAAATGLTVTAKVWEITDANAKSPNDTTGTTATVTEIGGGAYKAPHTMGADGVPIAVFSTTGTADVKAVPASFVHLGLLDTIVTAVGDVHATDLPALKAVVDNIHDTDLPAVKADTGNIYADTHTTILGRLVGTIATGTHNPQTGDSFAVVKSGGTGDNAAIKTQLSNIHDTDLPAVKTDTAAVKVQTDKLAFTTANQVDARVLTNSDKTGYSGTASNMVAAAPSAADNAAAVWGTATKAVTSIPAVTGATLSSAYDHSKDDVLTPLAVVDGNVDAILVDTSTTLDAAIAALPTDADVNAACDTAIADAGIPAAAATAVWGTATKAVTAIPDVQLAATQDHITPYSGTPPIPPSADAIADEVQTRTIARVTLVDTTTTNTDMVAAAPTTAQIEAALLNEGDSSALLQAIADKVSGDWSAGDVSATAVASAVRTNLATELGRIDAAITTRSTYAGGDTSGTTELLTRIPDATAGATGGLAIVGSSVVASNMVAAAPTAVAVRTEMDANSTKLAHLDADVSSRLAISGYTAPPALTGLATEANATTNKNAVISALPAAAPSAATIAALVLTDPTHKIVTNSDGSVNAQATVDTAAIADAVVAAIPDVSVDLTPATDAIAALHNFDPATDVVAHVTLADTVTTLTNAPTVPTADAIADEVQTRTIARVTLVDTATTLTNKNGFSGTATNMVAAAPSLSDLPTSAELASAIAELATVQAAPDISGLATKTEVLALSPVTVGSLDMTPVTEAIEAIPAPTFTGTVTFDGTVDASVDMTPVTNAIAAIPAPTFDGTVAFTGTVSAPSVTVNPTVLSTGERAAIAAVTDSVITANHGTGTYGSATLAAGVVITPVTLGTDGTALGRVMPYGRVTVYHGGEAQYVFNADADGDYSYELPVGSVWTLVARRSGYQDTEATVSTEDAVS